MTRINKFLVALGGAATITGTALADGNVDATEGRSIALAFAAAGLVWLIPNKADA